MKIFSKITSNEYNNRLEKILENKLFSEDVKNLLLSMLYKIENGYNDYSKVKINAISKDKFIEKILNVVEEQCFEINIVTPKTKLSKPLEEENAICKVDADKGSILVYANEEYLLYSLIQMNFFHEEFKYKKNNDLKILKKTYYEKAIKEFILKSICIDGSEIIRDFDGWSWNNNIKTNVNIEYNLLFQTMMMLNIKISDTKFYNENFEKCFTEENPFQEKMYIMILTLVSEQNKEIKVEVINRQKELVMLLTLMEDKKTFLDKISNKKKAIFNDIKKIDETISDKSKLKEEYDRRNSKLPNKEKIFSVSFLLDILKKERADKFEELKTMNEFLDPIKYLKQKEKLGNENKLLENVVKNLEDINYKKKSIINVQIEFLKNLLKQIEKNSNNKEYLENVMYELRYYCLLPISKSKTISQIKELQGPIEKVMNIIIDGCIDKEIITNFSNSASLCYNILKYIFITKIIDLKEIKIKISKVREEKYVNETYSQISISIYDAKETESIYNENVCNLNLLNVKTNKRVPLFLK